MRWYATLVLSLLGGFAGAALFSFTPFGGEATRSYLMANPEVLPRAMEVLNQRERQARIDPVRDQLELASALGIGGTPGWIVGDQVIDGAVGHEKLAEAIAEARES